MKQFNRKKAALATSIALSLGLIGPVAYALTDATALGDLALVPYYTAASGFTTGLHIINTTGDTQVVKVRLRRATDSADVLDFNLVMSPFDEWTGSINASAGGGLGIDTKDTTCTVPQAADMGDGRTRLEAPVTNALNGDEGYIEIIGMGQADPGGFASTSRAQGLIASSTHVAGNPRTPADCDGVRLNFRAGGVGTGAAVSSTTGRVSFEETIVVFTDLLGSPRQSRTAYVDTPSDALKVSFFHRNNVTGMEVGGNAVHIKNFAEDAMITHQSGGNPSDPLGSAYPDLDGGPSDANNRGRYDALIRPNLGGQTILNDWSYNPENGVSTDWVVTVPGQYLMVDPVLEVGQTRSVFTDLPVRASFTVYDREEDQRDASQLAISPVVSAGVVDLPNEVNIIEWGGQNVYDSQTDVTTITPAFQDTRFGWATLSLAPATVGVLDAIPSTIVESDPQLIFDIQGTIGGLTVGLAPTNAENIPVIAFTAWQREFGDVSKAYGHLVYHSKYGSARPAPADVVIPVSD